jgi:hypothetical protein
MTLQALREKVGDLACFRIMRDWATEKPLRQRHHTAVHPTRRAGSGLDLQMFLTAWLYAEGKPTSW